MIMRLEGCANIIGFRRFIPMSTKRVVQRDDAEDDGKIEAIVCKIRSGWLGQVLVATVRLSAKRVARLRHW